MIVVFDGMCNVCNGYVGFLARHDVRRRLTFVPAASERGRRMLVECGEAPDDPSTMIVIDGDVRLLRSDAVLAALTALGGRWRAARMLAVVPRPWRDVLYTGFASRRYRWFGRATTCAVCDAGSPRR